MSLNERIRAILMRKKWQDQELARKLGMSKAVLSQRFSKSNWTLDEIKSICEWTGYSLQWIVDGYGPELDENLNEAIDNYIQQTSKAPVINDGEILYPAKVKRIPFYDVEATGGINGADVSPVSNPTSTIDIGDFLRDSEAAIRMAGNSMMPGYPPGCILGLVPKRGAGIIPGEVYVYEDQDGRHCKRLFYKNDDPTSDVYACYSDTTTKFESGPREGKLFYPAYEVKADQIVKMWVVVGVIKRNINGAISYKQPDK